jgi:hypothetical protein
VSKGKSCSSANSAGPESSCKMASSACCRTASPTYPRRISEAGNPPPPPPASWHWLAYLEQNVRSLEEDAVQHTQRRLRAG